MNIFVEVGQALDGVEGVELIGVEDGRTLLRVEPGVYEFVVKVLQER